MTHKKLHTKLACSRQMHTRTQCIHHTNECFLLKHTNFHIKLLCSQRQICTRIQCILHSVIHVFISTQPADKVHTHARTHTHTLAFGKTGGLGGTEWVYELGLKRPITATAIPITRDKKQNKNSLSLSLTHTHTLSLSLSLSPHPLAVFSYNPSHVTEKEGL